jgi:hypothetical protein
MRSFVNSSGCWKKDDPVIDDWVTGRQSVPKEHDDRIMTLLREFRPLRTDRREE